jgi:urea transport system permease protein
VNNAVRRAAEAAMGGLTLFSPDATIRRSAAEAVLKSRDRRPPALARALAQEKDAGHPPGDGTGAPPPPWHARLG